MNAPGPASTPFLPERTAIRGLCSTEVVFSHALQAAGVGLAGIVVLGTVAGWLTGFLAHLGFVAVGLFMALSSYLILGSLERNRDMKRYFVRRVKRTWPLFFGTCVAVFLLMDRNWVTLAYNLAFLAPWFPAHTFSVPFNTASGYVVWNLEIEEWAYLCFPLVICLSEKGRTVVGYGLVGGSVAAYMGAQAGLSPWSVTYISPFPWLVCFGAGILAYEATQDFQRWGPVVTVGMVLSVLLVPWPWVMVGSAPFAAWVVKYPPLWLRKVALVAVGEISYGTYLVHMAFIDYLGPLGAIPAFAAGGGLEYLQRGRDIRKNIRKTRSMASVGDLPKIEALRAGKAALDAHPD